MVRRQAPFTVYAGNRRITDIGTKFSVYRNGDDVRVWCAKGGCAWMSSTSRKWTPVVAEAGHAVITKGGETLVMAKPTRYRQRLSWRSGMLVFNQQTLAEAADQFNRYNERQIFVGRVRPASIRRS